MKKYLIRSGMLPTDLFGAPHILVENSIGGNVGNLIYAYSIYRTLTTKDAEFVPDYYKVNENDADFINETYDAYFIPLADAFRANFESKLKAYTKLIEKLTIPVYVIGVGLKADFEPDFSNPQPFDNAVRDFCRAVLKRSHMIGVRGEFTVQYLNSLGFVEGRDHMAIGCPSMYSFGRNLKIRDTKITKESFITVNSSKLSPHHILDFIDRSTEEFPNYYFIPQWLKELKMTYLGGPALENAQPGYPNSGESKVYQQDRVRYFLNAPTWLEFIGEADLSFGTRLHGNITATVAGTPSIIIPKDGRMRELTNYHALNHVWAHDIDENTHLLDLVEKSDFHSCERVQDANFERYLSFLDSNDIDHIYKNGAHPEVSPLDEQLAKIDLLPPLDSFVNYSHVEMANRFQHVLNLTMDQKERRLEAMKVGRQKEVQRLQKKITHLEGTLNRKSVRTSLKIANLFSN